MGSQPVNDQPSSIFASQWKIVSKSLLLCAPPPDWKGENVILSEMSGFPGKRKIDPAGKAFEEYLVRGYWKKSHSDNSPSVSRSEDSGAESGDDAKHREEYEKKKKKKMTIEEDYYELLGLGHLRWKATQKDIKDSYRKAVLVYHPDKLRSEGELDDSIFKKIQIANEVLTNDDKRRAYDSKEDFNDSFPTSIPFDGNFYTAFTIVFERFSKWSMSKNIPVLGDDNTPLETVFAFYKFWDGFKSWRDFSFEDEYTLDDAESRDERRWMERQNKKGREKYKKQERANIIRLVETAYGLDPRINKWKAEQDEEKQKIKRAKAEIVQRKKDELERRANQEKQKKEEAEKAKSDEAARVKRAKLDEERTTMRLQKSFRRMTGKYNLSVVHTEKFLTDCSQDKIRQIFNDLERCGNEGAAKDIFTKELAILANGGKEPQSAAVKENFEKKANGLDVAPGETSTNGHANGSEHNGTSSPSPDTPEPSPAAARDPSPASWTEDEQKALDAALAKHSADLGAERWDRVATEVPDRSRKECVMRFKWLADQQKKKQKATASSK